ncbi:transporter substrate-binding domain-containing protein [Undibacterium jejuense]|uniref:Transporter substrate-binding domain-containing protein n=1 Tax=Undibacterium jejuense TaxID=1344949 RepID=A0A923KKL1_9BURK|nr:transporter substrate-binding domain-containing protein [Undibacterium jejuense]MBC3862035.1 transporter substrate-binding domain-containing protein [Undibacterium jejuense]
MHRWFSDLFVLFTISLATSATVLAQEACPKVVISADPAYPPLHWYDGQHFQGASITLTTKALNAIGVPFEFRYLGPWKRVLIAAENGSIDLVTSLKDTPERREFLTFSLPLLSNPVAVFVRKGESFSFAKKEDLIGRRGGVARGNRFGQPFDSFMDEHLQVEVTHNMETSFRMLIANRFDYVLTGYYPATNALMTSKLDLRIQAVKPFVTETANLVGFVSKSPCLKYLNAFNEQIDKMRKNGDIDRELKKATEEWRRHPMLHKD